MATLNIAEFSSPFPYGVQTGFLPPYATQNVTVGAESAQSDALHPSTCIVRLLADADCYVAIGADPLAAPGDLLLSAGTPEYFSCANGADLKIAAVVAS